MTPEIPRSIGTQYRGTEENPTSQENSSTADIMDLVEIEEKMNQYCQLWELYAEASYELTRKSKLSPTEAAKACKIYEPYIRDILQQVGTVMTIFVMEKELRNLKGRGHFSIPTITPHGTRVDNPQQVRKNIRGN